MNIRDIDVFRNLTNHVLEQHIHTASAQTIANILWAHRTVHIEPPRQLLDSWASFKLPGLAIAKSSTNGAGSTMNMELPNFEYPTNFETLIDTS
jgi:hypothetical protein